jgi:hypothetical protein
VMTRGRDYVPLHVVSCEVKGVEEELMFNSSSPGTERFIICGFKMVPRWSFFNMFQICI